MDTSSKPVICPICGKTYGKMIYRNKHMKNVHKLNSKGERIPEKILPVSMKKVACDICNRTYNSKSSLQRHIDAKHFVKDEKFVECGYCGYKTIIKSHLKRHIRRKHETPAPDRPFKCAHCSADYNHLTSLKHHERKVHKLINFKPVSFKKKCPLCSFVSFQKSRSEIFSHFKDAHNIPIKWETYTFKDMNKFYEWKITLEKSTTASYVESIKLQRFVCNRRGHYKPQGRNIRPLKKVGTRKINGFCPSEIQTKVLANGQVRVRYLRRHVGHKNELKYIRSSDKRTGEHASQFMNETCPDSVLADEEFSSSVKIEERLDSCSYDQLSEEKINERESSSSENLSASVKNEETLDGSCSCDQLDEEEDIFNNVCVEIHEEDQLESRKRRLEEKIKYFVDYCNQNVKSDEQLTYLEELMEQAMSTVCVMAVAPH